MTRGKEDSNFPAQICFGLMQRIKGKGTKSGSCAEDGTVLKGMETNEVKGQRRTGTKGG